MPISFFHPYEMESFSINSKTKQFENLINFIHNKELENPSDENKDHNISLKLETKYVKSSNTSTLEVYNSNNPNSLHVIVDSEDSFAKKYTLSYKQLINILKNKYSDFKQNPIFNNYKNKFTKDDKYC
jgi:hypothetical protein